MILKSTLPLTPARVYDDLRAAERESAHLYITAEEYLPLLPAVEKKWNTTLNFRGAEYNPCLFSCSCEVRGKTLTQYQPNDIRGFCPHLAYFFRRRVLANDTGILSFLLEQNMRQRALSLYPLMPPEGQSYAGIQQGSLWVNVYLRRAGWSKYAYHLGQKRWARKKEPPAEEDIRRALEQVFRYTLPIMKESDKHGQ